MNNNNIIYINDNFYMLSLERIRLNILNLATSKFNSSTKAEKWLVRTHPKLGLSPDLMLGTYQGKLSVLDVLNHEQSNWEPSYE